MSKRSKQSEFKMYSYVGLAVFIILITGALMYTRNEYNLNY